MTIMYQWNVNKTLYKQWDLQLQYPLHMTSFEFNEQSPPPGIIGALFHESKTITDTIKPI